MADLRAMIPVVFMLFIGFIVYAQITPELNKVNEAVAQADETGMASATLDTVNSVPDPKGEIKQASGNILLNLLENHPVLFIMLVVIVAAIFVYVFGFTISQVRGF